MSHPVAHNSSPSPETRLRNMHLRPSSLELPPRIAQKSQDLPSPFSEGHFSMPQPVRRTSRPQQNPLTLKTTPEALDPAADYVTLKAPPFPQHHRSRTGSEVPRSSLGALAAGSASTSSLPSPAAKPSTQPASQTPSAATPSSSPEFQSPRASAVGQAADMQARIMALQRSRSKRAQSQSQGQGGCPSPQLLTPLRRESNASTMSVGSSASRSARTSVSTLDSALSFDDEKPRSPEDPPAEAAMGAPGTAAMSASSAASTPTPTASSSSSATVSPTNTTTDSPMISKQPLARNGFDPNTVISPTAASAAAAGGAISLGRAPSFRSKQRSSLSARRGLKLNAMPDERKPAVPTTVVSASKVPAAKGNRGLFRDYRKYLDIETGSLKFNGKACVHAQGIEFSSGEKFNISIDKLKFISELGSGNYGTVQKVLHTRNGVFMAVKEIRLELDEASLHQIIMELDVLHRCETRSIISFYGAFFVEGSVYICMEYMNGGSINKIYEGGVPEKYLKYIVRAVVSGLKELKENFNIIHRDVKPTNILCSSSGAVKLCDFGVSGNLVASMARTNVGCQAYMAPERIKGDRFSAGRDPNQPLTYTAESDIWSLGLSIIEMASGCYPYPSDMYMSIFSQLNAIVEEPSPALDSTKYSPEACDFVSKLLCKRPDQRPNYANIMKHPWLATEDCTPEEFGAFVRSRMPKDEE